MVGQTLLRGGLTQYLPLQSHSILATCLYKTSACFCGKQPQSGGCRGGIQMCWDNSPPAGRHRRETLGRLCTAEQEGGRWPWSQKWGLQVGCGTMSCWHCHPWLCPGPPSFCTGAVCPLPWALPPGDLLSARMKLMSEG